jgi:hypothetical protein
LLPEKEKEHGEGRLDLKFLSQQSEAPIPKLLNTLDLYLGVAWFKSWPGHCRAGLRFFMIKC